MGSKLKKNFANDSEFSVLDSVVTTPELANILEQALDQAMEAHTPIFFDLTKLRKESRANTQAKLKKAA